MVAEHLIYGVGADLDAFYVWKNTLEIGILNLFLMEPCVGRSIKNNIFSNQNIFVKFKHFIANLKILLYKKRK